MEQYPAYCMRNRERRPTLQHSCYPSWISFSAAVWVHSNALVVSLPASSSKISCGFLIMTCIAPSQANHQAKQITKPSKSPRTNFSRAASSDSNQHRSILLYLSTHSFCHKSHMICSRSTRTCNVKLNRIVSWASHATNIILSEGWIAA